MARQACAGAILAGGRSERMGGGYKALATLAGRPMIAHVVERLRDQADPLVLSVQGPDAALEVLGLPQLPDMDASHRGPLMGLYTALRHRHDSEGAAWLLLCPCDAPFLPLDLADRLLATAGSTGARVVAAASGGHPQPTFSAWHTDVLPEVERAVRDRGQGGLMHMLDHLPHRVVDWETSAIPPFYNVNTRAELQQAAHWIARQEHGA